MSSFQRQEPRFFCKGVCLNAPQDACPDGKYPILRNARSYQQGTLQARLGLTAIANGALGAGAIHSITRLNDPTPFAAAAFFRVFGAGAVIRAGNTTYPQIDTGYSGNPLSFVTAAPVGAPNPYVYVGDSSRMRKFDVNGHLYPIGIAAPLAAPSGVVGSLPIGYVFKAGTGPAFIAAGTAAGAVATLNRINTTIAQIIYDSGATGNCSVVPTSFAGINANCIINYNGVESLPVFQVCVKVASTTIASIIYDAGTTGLCTIQPAASLGTGQVEVPQVSDYLGRLGDYASPARLQQMFPNLRGWWSGVATGVDTQITQQLQAQSGMGGLPPQIDPGAVASHTIRQVDFPVNCLVTLAGAETVRILSVALGPDGVLSFRCSTTGTRSAGDSIVGVASYRTFTNNNYVAGNTLQDVAYTNVLTPPAGPPPQTVGGVQSPGGFTVVNNMGQIVGRATQPDDDLHLSVRVSDLSTVQGIRVYLDVDATTNDYTRNYYMYEWRSSDLITALQSANAAPVDTVQALRPDVITNEILNQSNPAITGALYAPGMSPGQMALPGGSVQIPLPTQSGLGTAMTTVSDQLGGGNSQWLDLTAKISQLTRVGNDPSRTFQDVVAVEVLVEFTGSNPITVDYDSLWISGGFGPDIGALGVPYTYCYRYRSTITGAKSNPSPATRAGFQLRRQNVALTGVQSADPQVDVVDWFRIGGTLPRMTYVGTTANANPPTFTDVYRDVDIDGGDPLEYTYFQPWATTDKQRTGTVTVAGNAVRQTGGTDAFSTSWAPGTPIIINGRVYTLYAQPSSPTLLFTNENVGSGTGLTYTVPQPTLLSQNLPGYWGPTPGDYTTFACGDPNNPGGLYYTIANDPDRTSDQHMVMVTSGSDPLQNGCIWDDIPFVFSTANLYQIQSDGRGGWVGNKTPCGRGLWTRWAFTASSPRGIYFLAKDGIYLTPGGGPAVSITDADLYPLFPHDGIPAVAVNGFNPPDMTQVTRLRLSYVNGWLYFDYLDTAAASKTLAYREADGTWWPDSYTPGITTRWSSDGPAVYEELIGGTDGTVYNPSGALDGATGISATARLVLNQGDARRQKVYRDVMLDADLTSSQLTVAATGTNASIALASQTLVGSTGRQEYFTNVLPGKGILANNLTVDLSWTPVIATAPILYLIDAAFQPVPELASSWLSGMTTHGLSGWQSATLAMVAYVSSTALTFTVVVDGVTYSYALPSSGGVYTKQLIWLQTVKGMTFQYGVQAPSASSPFILFHDDTEVWVTQWGRGDYNKTRPFAASTKAA